MKRSRTVWKTGDGSKGILAMEFTVVIFSGYGGTLTFGIILFFYDDKKGEFAAPDYTLKRNETGICAHPGPASGPKPHDAFIDTSAGDLQGA